MITRLKRATGIKDSNGVMIRDGDKLRMKHEIESKPGLQFFDRFVYFNKSKGAWWTYYISKYVPINESWADEAIDDGPLFKQLEDPNLVWIKVNNPKPKRFVKKHIRGIIRYTDEFCDPWVAPGKWISVKHFREMVGNHTSDYYELKFRRKYLVKSK